jgi:D-beta-D-heptose 7-phosphate kinase/D-beta-D-heptose 1-phosphate adenosyltransferase
MSDKRKTIMVSGGFDPIHVGHVRMILEASKHGDVIVVANSDDWLYRKKGYIFMAFKERKEILMAIKGVIDVVAVHDDGGTVCSALIEHEPTYFANGGDRKQDNTPEKIVCEQLGIEMLWNVGGEKIQSSSELVEKTNEKKDS